MDPPVRLRLGDNETEVNATEAITAVIRLRTKVGELITRKHRCLIWEVPSDEIILGGDFLKQLGIDPESALETLIIENQNEAVVDDTEDQKQKRSTEVQRYCPEDDVEIGEIISEEVEAAWNS